MEDLQPRPQVPRRPMPDLLERQDGREASRCVAPGHVIHLIRRLVRKQRTGAAAYDASPGCYRLSDHDPRGDTTR